MRLTIGVVVLSLAAGVAQAGPIEDADAAFQQGKELEKQGNAAAACAQYRKAMTLNPAAIGALLNVALCDQNEKKYASAYRLFKKAADQAREQNLDEHLKAAEDHLAQVEPYIGHLGLAFVDPPAPDTEILVAGQIVPNDPKAYSDIYVDEGEVQIVVSRPGRVAYEKRVMMEKGSKLSVAIPPLDTPVTVKSGRHLFGEITTFTGAGLVVTSVVVGLIARSDYKDATSHCANGICELKYQNEVDNARTLGNVGTGIGIGGIVVAGVGAYLWLFGHHSDKLAFVPSVDPQQLGLAAVGRF